MTDHRTNKGREPGAVDGVKRTDRRKREGVKKVVYFNGKLVCGRCGNGWLVVDLNPEHKAVPCPICGDRNDIKDAIRRAA
jgi:transcription elongation factor Elf1